jgi:hypothetical protein
MMFAGWGARPLERARLQQHSGASAAPEGRFASRPTRLAPSGATNGLDTLRVDLCLVRLGTPFAVQDGMKCSWTLAVAVALASVSCGNSETAPASDAGAHAGGSSAGGSSAGTGGSNTGGTIAGTGGSNTGGTRAGTGGATTGTGGASSGGVGGRSAGGANAAGSGGEGAGGANAGGKSCDGAKCTSAQICIAYRTVGGGLIRADAGACPDGTHVEPLGAAEFCQRDYSYKCVTRAGCSAAAVSCACGSAACASPYPACSDPESGDASLDPSAQLVCQQLAP